MSTLSITLPDGTSRLGMILQRRCGLCGGEIKVTKATWYNPHFVERDNELKRNVATEPPPGSGRWIYTSQCQKCGAIDG